MKMRINFWKRKQFLGLLLISTLLVGCTSKKQESSASPLPETKKTRNYEVDAETFALTIKEEGRETVVSLPGQKRQVENFVQDETETTWEYPEEKIALSIKQETDYLYVTITSQTKEDNEFQWPNISGETYYMPLGEGKRIPQTDAAWNAYLKGNEFSVLEQLSMPFWAAVNGDSAVMFVMENPYRSDLIFSEEEATSFRLNHKYPAIDKEKKNSFRIYLTDNNPVTVSKIYREYVKEQGKFVTLEEKAEQNPNIKKLYGAPHIYLWGENLIAPENIDWPTFRKSIDSKVVQYILQLASQTERGEEAIQSVKEIASQDYVSEYQKNNICGYLSEILQMEGFYDSVIFSKQNEKMKELMKKGLENLNESERILWNKHALATNLSDVFHPADEWMNSGTTDLLDELKDSGIDQAWIGLNSWVQAYAKPELAKHADTLGYLMGPYDSYHSIHETNKEQWITAKFEDSTLYDNAAVENKNGEKISGFQNVGRKLNPTLSMPAVKQRMEKVVSNEQAFQSWFIDCDATGEIYDDYTKEHVTTQQEDLNARLERMSYIRDQYNMVIGSEGGNDFAASVIAFAHGIELKTFSWMDEDMKTNKDSEYYIGKYYSPTGGVAEHFSKQIPIKDDYYKIFVDPKYDLPLYKLVYNDSVITSYHWDWSTFKIKGEVKDRMLREVLYNVPPLYHFDRDEWNKYKEDITAHTKVWSQFSKQAITQEMTDFKYLKEDGSVQMSQYGTDLSVIANFGESSYSHEGEEIPAHALLLNQNGETSVYSPEVVKENQ